MPLLIFGDLIAEGGAHRKVQSRDRHERGKRMGR